MTDLKDRLELLAREATDGLLIENPSTGPLKARRGRLLVLAAALILAGTAIGLVLTRDNSSDVSVVAADGPIGRPAIFDRPHTSADVVPEYYGGIGLQAVELDLTGLRAGPSADGFTVYVVPTADGLGYCTYLVPDTEELFRQSGTAATGCTTFALLVTRGFSLGGFGSPDWEIAFGVAAGDVTGVEVDGEAAAFEDGVFLAAGTAVTSSDNPEDGPDDFTPVVSLIREPARAALVDACDALGPLVSEFDRPGMSAADVDVLVVRAERVPAFERLAELLAPHRTDGLQLEPDGDGLAPDLLTELGAAGNDAAKTCERADVPGWAVVYQPPTRFLEGPPSVAVDLDDYGLRQDLEVTSATSRMVAGPDLIPVSRIGIGGTDVVVFWSYRYGDSFYACTQAQIDTTNLKMASRSCGQSPPDREVLSLLDEAQAPPGGLTVYTMRARTGAAFATARVGDVTYVQVARGEFFAFALPGGLNELEQHRSDGTVISGGP